MEFGTILLHDAFQFPDGEVSKKYLIVLNTPKIEENEVYAIAKTTSRQKRRDTQFGCSKNKLTFHIPAKQCFFPLDTWIILNEIYLVEPNSLLADKMAGVCNIVGSLNENFKKYLIDCIRSSDDIEENILNLILTSYYRK